MLCSQCDRKLQISNSQPSCKMTAYSSTPSLTIETWLAFNVQGGALCKIERRFTSKKGAPSLVSLIMYQDPSVESSQGTGLQLHSWLHIKDCSVNMVRGSVEVCTGTLRVGCFCLICIFLSTMLHKIFYHFHHQLYGPHCRHLPALNSHFLAFPLLTL